MPLGLGLHVRLVKARRALSRWWRHRARTPIARRAVERLHIGCGPQAFEGWTNVDLQNYEGVDLVHDVREGLPFRDVRYLFAEHFLEHLTYDEGLRFLKECRASLAADGVLRLSTPNLDWVVRTQYTLGPSPDAEEALQACFALNRSFRGWGHHFLYNAATLTATLQAAGFAEVSFHEYGRSGDPVLENLERHERWGDTADLPHVLVVEARGLAPQSMDRLQAHLDEYDQAVYLN